MADDDITLEDLSSRTGVEARTLRSWVSEGLLSPPAKTGRGARYPAANADRALAVRALKELHGLSLTEIGRRFLLASEAEIRAWAGEIGPVRAPLGSAREYLSRIRAAAAPAAAPPAPFPQKPPLSAPRPAPDTDRTAGLASVERLILQLEAALGAPAPRRSKGDVWTRISVTPDLELGVRGDLEPRERVLFEKLADQFRAILLGGTKND